MKLRIKGNTIRLRLTKSEVENFAQGAVIEDILDFGNSHLSYVLRTDYIGKEITAKYALSEIAILIPEKIAKEFTSTDSIGVENKLDIGLGKQLFILIEKDFVCLDNTLEDQSDNYPNPNATC